MKSAPTLYSYNYLFIYNDLLQISLRHWKKLFSWAHIDCTVQVYVGISNTKP